MPKQNFFGQQNDTYNVTLLSLKYSYAESSKGFLLFF